MKNQHISHLVLGLPTTASVEEASIGFARASKRIKKMEDPPFSVQDLTAALAAVESDSGQSLRFEFNLPADPETIIDWNEVRAGAAIDAAQSAPEEQASAHLYRSIQELLQWRWEEAEHAAKEVLKISDSEQTRDEALNVLALSLAMRGDMDRAISALKQAIEGQWNISLQQNLGILALEEDQELATSQATFWLDSATTADERREALLTVLGMLMSMQENATDDDSQDVTIPPRVLEAFRQAMASDLPEETFGLLGTFMGQNDRDWVLKASNWAGAPLGASPTANMIHARAEGFDHFVDFLMDNTGADSRPVQEAINRLVSDMNAIMLEEDTAVGPAGICINLFDKGLDMATFERILARPLTAREICLVVGDDGGEPVEKVLDWLVNAKHAASTFDGPQESRDLLLDIIGGSGDLAAAVFHDSRADDVRGIARNLEQVNYMSSTFGGRRRINKTALRQAAWEMRNWCLDTRRIHEKCMKVAVEEDVRQAWNDLMQGVYAVERNIQNYL